MGYVSITLIFPAYFLPDIAPAYHLLTKDAANNSTINKINRPINLKKLDLIKKIENEYQNHLKAVLMLMMLNLILLLKNGFVVLLLLVNQINMLDLFKVLQMILQQIKLIGLNLLIKFKFKRISIMIYIMILLLVLKFLDK